MDENTAVTASPASLGRRSSHWLVIFLALVALTGLELYSTGLDVDRALRITLLCGLAIIKGALVLLFFMHLRAEPRALKLTVLVPIVISAAFAVVVMLETVTRLK